MAATLVCALYVLARAAIPPTGYVIVSLEDSRGAAVEIPSSWSGSLFMTPWLGREYGEPQLREGLAIACAALDQETDESRRAEPMGRWTLSLFGKRKYVSFGM